MHQQCSESSTVQTEPASKLLISPAEALTSWGGSAILGHSIDAHKQTHANPAPSRIPTTTVVALWQ